MLSDEEKKAIEWVKNDLEETIKLGQKYGLQEAIKYQTTILNLIEKQSKEIEHQKEKRENQKKELAILNTKQIEFNKLVNTVNSYKGQFKRQQKEIEELKVRNNKLAQCHFKYEEMTRVDLLLPDKLEYISKEESEQKEKKAYIDGTNIADKLCNKKWEDKIKAKIEGYEKECKNCEFGKFLCKHCFIETIKQVMQSLLEKE